MTDNFQTPTSSPQSGQPTILTRITLVDWEQGNLFLRIWVCLPDCSILLTIDLPIELQNGQQKA